MTRFALLLPLLALLPGCIVPVPLPPGTPDTCGAEALSALVGQNRSEERV